MGAPVMPETEPLSTPVAGPLAVLPLYATAADVLVKWDDPGQTWRSVTPSGGTTGTVTSITAGTGMTLSPTTITTTGSIALTVPVAVANGGTGATTAGAALTALGAAPLNAPVFTGDARAVTPATADNDTSIATTAYVQAQGYATSASVSTADNLRVLKAGDTMTGQLNINGGTAGNSGIALAIASSSVDCFLRHSSNSGAQVWTAGSSNADYWIYDTTGAKVCIAIAKGTGACFNQSGTWNALSDGALKQDVEPYRRGLAAIQALNPVAFRYKPGTPFAGETEPSRVLYGLIAEEVAPHIPEIVGETNAKVAGEDRMVGTLEPGNIVYALINSVKELSAKVAALEAGSASRA